MTMHVGIVIVGSNANNDAMLAMKPKVDVVSDNK
jgi:hypothetical protein